MGKKNINKCWGENDNIMGERGKNMEVEEEGRWKWKEKKNDASMHLFKSG